MSAASQKTARRIRDHAHRQAERAQRTIRAKVSKLDPLTLEPFDDAFGNVLEIDDDFDLTAWMKFYDARYGIAVGDTALLHRNDGHFAFFDVLTDMDVS